MDAGYIIQTDWRIIRLCRRCEDRAEADVIGAFVERADRLVDAVRRSSDSALRPDNFSRLRNRQIVLPQMHAFGANRLRDLRMIVNDERHAAFGCDVMQFDSQLFNFRERLAFSAELQQIDSAGNERFRDLPGFTYLDITEIENAVEPAAAEIGGGQASDYSCNRAGIGLISNSSEFMSRSTKPVS
jgi:hypothetical protein